MAAIVPAGWLGNWTDHIVRTQPHFVDRFFPFDAVWYGRIADDLYAWDPMQPLLKQDAAFFPLWPMVLLIAHALAGGGIAGRWAVVGIAAACAAASIFAFHRLARRVLPPRAADTATLLFGLYPGASFLLLSYPTGLMNLLCILSLLALMDGRLVAAAACSGLVTASGPLGLGTALTVCTCAAVRAFDTMKRHPVQHGLQRGMLLARILAGLAALGMVSVAGLLALLAWQAWKFGDPLAFVKAQEAWAIPKPWWQRIPRGALQLIIIPDFTAALGHLWRACRAATLVMAQDELEKSLNCAGMGIGLISLLACLRLRCLPLLLQGGFTMLLFIWFHSTSRPGNSTLRLTYCAVGMFIGLASLLSDRPRLEAATLAISAAVLASGAFFTAAGYHVV